MWKWIKRIVLGLLGLIVLLVGLLAAIIAYDAAFGPETTDFANMTFTDAEGNTLNGYLATPEGAGPHPAVLLIHEWWGLNAGITVLADALAQEGYVVLAPDAFRGNVTARIPRALWLTLTTPEAQIKADLDAALAHLLSLEAVDPDHVATMGFCFGGGHSLQLGLRESQSLAVTVMYYGAVVTDPDLLRPFTDGTAVLGIFAEEDQTIFVEDVLEFEAALNSLDVENQITIYEDVGHAFVNEENYAEPDTAGGRAWQEAITFLETHLQDG